jgi:hypothetical protein
MKADEMLAAVAQTVILLSNGCFTYVYTPQNVNIYKDLFVVSIVFLVSLAEIFLLAFLRILFRKLCRFHTNYGVHMLFRPLTTAIQTPKSDRMGDLSQVNKNTTDYTIEKPQSSQESISDVDLELSDLDSNDARPIVEHRNTYVDVYGLGWACFATLYACDTSSELPSISFVFTLLTLLFMQGLYTLSTLFQNYQRGFVESEEYKKINTKKALMIGSTCMCLISFSVLTVSLGQNILPRQDATIASTFLSIILPSTAPILLISVPPSSTPLRLLAECLPFVLTLSLSYIMFFIGTKGELSAAIRQINDMQIISNSTNFTEPTSPFYLPSFELDVHFQSNETIHFSASMDTSVEVNNVLLLLIAPIFKVPALICILASIISRQLLTVTSCLLLILSMRMFAMNSHNFSDHANSLFLVSFIFALLAVATNNIKHFFFS